MFSLVLIAPVLLIALAMRGGVLKEMAMGPLHGEPAVLVGLRRRGHARPLRAHRRDERSALGRGVPRARVHVHLRGRNRPAIRGNRSPGPGSETSLVTVTASSPRDAGGALRRGRALRGHLRPRSFPSASLRTRSNRRAPRQPEPCRHLDPWSPHRAAGLARRRVRPRPARRGAARRCARTCRKPISLRCGNRRPRSTRRTCPCRYCTRALPPGTPRCASQSRTCMSPSAVPSSCMHFQACSPRTRRRTRSRGRPRSCRKRASGSRTTCCPCTVHTYLSPYRRLKAPCNRPSSCTARRCQSPDRPRPSRADAARAIGGHLARAATVRQSVANRRRARAVRVALAFAARVVRAVAERRRSGAARVAWWLCTHWPCFGLATSVSQKEDARRCTRSAGRCRSSARPAVHARAVADELNGRDDASVLRIRILLLDDVAGESGLAARCRCRRFRRPTTRTRPAGDRRSIRIADLHVRDGLDELVRVHRSRVVEHQRISAHTVAHPPVKSG